MHDPALSACGGDLPRYGERSLRARQARDEARSKARGGGHGLGDLDAVRLELGASRRVDVEADRAPARRDEVTGDRAAHDAQSDDADRVRHSILAFAAAPRLRWQPRGAVILSGRSSQ